MWILRTRSIRSRSSSSSRWLDLPAAPPVASSRALSGPLPSWDSYSRMLRVSSYIRASGNSTCTRTSYFILQSKPEDYITAKIYEYDKHIYLCLLLFCGINNGGAADFSNFTPLPIKWPTADLISNHVFDEEYSPVEPQRQLVKQLNIFQHVVIRIAGEQKYLHNIHKIFFHLLNADTGFHLNRTHLVYEYLLLLLLYSSLTVGCQDRSLWFRFLKHHND